MKKAFLLSAVVLALPLSVSFAGGMGNSAALSMYNGTANTQSVQSARMANGTIRYTPTTDSTFANDRAGATAVQRNDNYRLNLQGSRFSGGSIDGRSKLMRLRSVR